jgi:hypothetical protein
MAWCTKKLHGVSKKIHRAQKSIFSFFSFAALMSSKHTEPVHHHILVTRETDLVIECHPLLEGGIHHCIFDDALPDSSLTLPLTRGHHNLYSLDLALPAALVL